MSEPVEQQRSEYTIPCRSVAVLGGGSDQMICQPEGSVEIRGLSVSEGFEVRQVWVGKEQLSLEQAIGRSTPVGSYLIGVVVNTTDKILRCDGAWLVRGGNPPKAEAAKAAQPDLSGGPIPQGLTREPPQAQPAQRAQPVAAAIPAERLVESNEIPVYLTRELAMRLYRSLYGGPGEAIRDNEKPDLQRRLETALRRT